MAGGLWRTSKEDDRILCDYNKWINCQLRCSETCETYCASHNRCTTAQGLPKAKTLNFILNGRLTPRDPCIKLFVASLLKMCVHTKPCGDMATRILYTTCMKPCKHMWNVKYVHKANFHFRHEWRWILPYFVICIKELPAARLNMTNVHKCSFVPWQMKATAKRKPSITECENDTVIREAEKIHLSPISKIFQQLQSSHFDTRPRCTAAIICSTHL